MSTEAEIKQALDATRDQLKEHAEKAVAEGVKSISTMTASVKQTVDELLVQKNELEARVTELEQLKARRGAEEDQKHYTPGEQFIHSEVFRKAREDGRLFRKGQNISMDLKAITSLTASAGRLLTPDVQAGVIALPQRRATIRSLVAPGRTDKPSVQYFRELVYTNAAAPTAENTRKPESNITFEDALARVIKIAHFIKASTEILDDAPALASIIDQRLRYGLEYVEENQLLNGSGTGNNLSGLYTNATAFVAPITIAGATRIDILRLAMLQSELALLPATGHVLNPADWAAIELTKDTTGQYIIGNPQGQIGATLWGLPVVTSMAMTADTFLTGNFRDAAQIFDRELANVVVSTENEDDFVTNRVTILAEERLALAIYRPQSIIKGDLTPGV
jgi:HK97 family phage major capsid protein